MLWHADCTLARPEQRTHGTKAFPLNQAGMTDTQTLGMDGKQATSHFLRAVHVSDGCVEAAMACKPSPVSRNHIPSHQDRISSQRLQRWCPPSLGQNTHQR